MYLCPACLPAPAPVTDTVLSGAPEDMQEVPGASDTVRTISCPQSATLLQVRARAREVYLNRVIKLLALQCPSDGRWAFVQGSIIAAQDGNDGAHICNKVETRYATS
jgi:hypothetical protein